MEEEKNQVAVVEQEEIHQPLIEHVHLANGEEVFGYLTQSEKGDGIILHNPLKSEMVESEDGEGYVVTLVPYMPFSDQSVIFIHYNHVVTHAPVHSEFAKFYYFSGHFADKQSDRRYLDMVHSNVRMAMAIMDETIADKKEQSSANFIQPEVNQIN